MLSLFLATSSALVAVAYGQQLNTAGSLTNDPRLTTFVDFLATTGVSPSTGRTIFAPDMDAWDAFQAADQDRWSKYTNQSEFIVHLKTLLEWHLVTEGQFTYEDIFNGVRQTLENSQGNITVDQRVRKLDAVPFTAFVQKNITTSDGMIHILSQVIVPPFMAVNMIEQLLNDRAPKFALTTMANLVLYVGLDEMIDADYEHGITFLVPPNQRFNRAQINVPQLLTAKMFNYTRDFVRCHIILNSTINEAGTFALQQAQGTQQWLIKSALGTSLWVTTTNDQLRFQSQSVLVPDQVSYNGLFHIMDYPLFPPFLSDYAFFTSISTSWDTSDCFRFFRQAMLSSQDISVMFNTSLTLFCPTREAFSFFNDLDFNRLLEPIWQRHATEFLLNMFTSPAMTAEELLAKAPSEITMLNGATYELKRSGNRPRIKNGVEQGRSDFGDIIALDGVLHMLDTAITPTCVSRSIYDQSQANPDFSLLVENIDFVDLTDLVDRDLPLTMLAPDNTAWRRVEFGAMDGGEIVKRHIFRGLLFLDVIANQTQIIAVNGVTHGVELRGPNKDKLWVGGAYVYEGDLLARNGVLHYVDRVIGMDYPTIPPSISPAPTLTATPTAYQPPTAAPVPRPTGAVPIYLPPIRSPTNDLTTTSDQQPTQTPGSSGAGRHTLLIAFFVWVVSGFDVVDLVT